MSEWERGAQVPQARHLGRIAERLQVDPDKLRGASLVAELEEPKELSSMPLLGSVAAGDPDAHEDVRIDRHGMGELLLPRGLMALEVIGDSMSPVVLPGQFVVCDTARPKPRDLVVCELKKGGAFFRRLSLVTKGGTYILESVNLTNGATVEVDPDDVLEMYRVVGVCYLGKRGGE